MLNKFQMGKFKPCKFRQCVFRLLIGSATACSLLISMSGCDQISGSPIVQIIGEVTMDRKPLADTMVAFVPLELRGANGKITELAFGKTDAAGRFELRTHEARGVVPGEYRVLFYRPTPRTDASANIGDGTDKAESKITGITSDASLILAAIERFDSPAQKMEKRLAMVNVGDVPMAYNIQSTLRLTVKPGSGIIYPKFELDAHPKN